MRSKYIINKFKRRINMELLGGNKNYSIAANREVQSERIMCEAILLDCEDS